MLRSLVGSEMCIRDSNFPSLKRHGNFYFVAFFNKFFHLFFLDGQLIRLMDVLITAAAAYAIITADGIRPPGRRLDDVPDSAAQKVLLPLGDFDFQFITGR